MNNAAVAAEKMTGTNLILQLNPVSLDMEKSIRL